MEPLSSLLLLAGMKLVFCSMLSQRLQVAASARNQVQEAYATDLA
jgi:hypothetical protein